MSAIQYPVRDYVRRVLIFIEIYRKQFFILLHGGKRAPKQPDHSLRPCPKSFMGRFLFMLKLFLNSFARLEIMLSQVIHCSRAYHMKYMIVIQVLLHCRHAGIDWRNST